MDLVGRVARLQVTHEGQPYKFEYHPSITRISHSSGSMAGGLALTIGGHLFGTNASAVKVDVDGVPCDVVSAAAGRIVCTTRAMDPPVNAVEDIPNADASASGDREAIEYCKDAKSVEECCGRYTIDPPYNGQYCVPSNSTETTFSDGSFCAPSSMVKGSAENLALVPDGVCYKPEDTLYVGNRGALHQLYERGAQKERFVFEGEDLLNGKIEDSIEEKSFPYESYSQRWRTVLRPAVTGMHRFVVTADDNVHVLLTTLDKQMNFSAVLEFNTWVSDALHKYPQNWSPYVELEAGVDYLLEVRHQ
ncbi:hypothetical protein CYMTET_24595 [Cymbomonas tetramitiformis]|uniref:IPT/TIG domain-containing protein n=1 Tax=Cymbomonas tetramitiformis TaxID=36881 RepID=A0AAE0FWY2_9CHLO|nr:hypothetical protein CYMTET_24595 [Cymbomonas tetramitiformis]